MSLGRDQLQGTSGADVTLYGPGLQGPSLSKELR